MKKKNDTTHHRDTEVAEVKKSKDKPCTLNAGRYTLSEASIKLLAMEGRSIAECEKLLERPTSNIQHRTSNKRNKKSAKSASKTLNDIFNEKPNLKAAFERGRFLYNLSQFGSKNYTITEAESELGLSFGSLENLFKTDTEAVDVWNSARYKTLLAIKDKWLEMVGMATPAALKQLEKLMSRGIVQAAADLTRISSKQMQDITKRSRQTIENDWPKIHGLKRNSDATYNLYVFFPWFEEFITRTRTAAPKIAESAATSEKARKYKMENDERAGRLLARDKVIAGLMARNQTITRIFSKSLIEQKDPFVKQTLERCFEEIRRELAATMPELKLTEEQVGKLKNLLVEIELPTSNIEHSTSNDENAHHEEHEVHEEIKN